MTANPRFNEAVFGLAGGLVEAIIMGLIAYLTPPPNTGGDPFFIAAASVMGFGSLAWEFGWFLHVLTGMGIGVVFGIVATRGRLRTKTVSNKVLLGVGVGIIAWVALFVPVMLFLSPVTASTESLGSGLVINVVFGVILVIVFAFGQSFFLADRKVAVYHCNVCGAALPNQEELDEHMRNKHVLSSPPVS